ncbi:MAG: SDR family NAD(P)-dependent oxidoreductase [Alphaproteobacteria bacterium]
MPKENRLQGKVAIITGAASGIGEATVTLFTEQGCRVIANDVPGSPLEDCHGGNPDVICVAKDVTDADGPQVLVAAAIDNFGRLDILFNNAGICPPEPILEQSPGQWERVLDVNVGAINRLTLAAVPHLQASGNGRVINTGSIQSQIAGESLTAYTTSKHAVAGLTKQQALELGPLGITANFIQPGFVVTGISKAYSDQMTEEEAREFEEFWINKNAVGRLGQPIDIANGALFLSLDSSNFINGTGLKMDGGGTARM